MLCPSPTKAVLLIRRYRVVPIVDYQPHYQAFSETNQEMGTGIGNGLWVGAQSRIYPTSSFRGARSHFLDTIDLAVQSAIIHHVHFAEEARPAMIPQIIGRRQEHADSLRE
jgi:hypothetical protein